jgi:hypothetical protein
MNDPQTSKMPEPLDPAAARIVARVRWLMLIAGATTFIAIGAVTSVIGYRVSRGVGSAADVTATLPKGARVIAISAAGERIVVTIELGGVLEVRTFDARTLAPAGRLRFRADDGTRTTEDR